MRRERDRTRSTQSPPAPLPEDQRPTSWRKGKPYAAAVKPKGTSKLVRLSVPADALLRIGRGRAHAGAPTSGSAFPSRDLESGGAFRLRLGEGVLLGIAWVTPPERGMKTLGGLFGAVPLWERP